MNRYFVLPAIAGVAWAQQATPGEAEKALRERADQYCQLTLQKKFRDIERLVAVDSRDDYYNGSKPDIKACSIAKVVLDPGEKRASVLMNSRVVVLALGNPQTFEIPTNTKWTFEEGEWRLSIDRNISVDTPFGRMKAAEAASTGTLDRMEGKAPDLATLLNSVELESKEVELSPTHRTARIGIHNKLPGSVRLTITSSSVSGVETSIEKEELSGQGDTGLLVRLTEAPAINHEGTIQIEVQPLNRVLQLKVRVAR